MKKYLLIIFFLTSIQTITAQENILKLGFITGNLGLQYERAISNHFSVIGLFGLSILPIGATLNKNITKEGTSSGIGYSIEGRYYFTSRNKDLMEGWHIGPYYNSVNTTYGINIESDIINLTTNLETNISSFGISAGYQIVFDSQVTLDFIVGAGSSNISTNYPGIEIFEDLKILPHFGISMGYKF